jgi:hypothetical protein
MDLGYLPPLPVGLIRAAARDLGSQILKLAAATRPLLPAWPIAAILGAIVVTWLINSMPYGFGPVRVMVAVCSGSLTATIALAVGWVTDPERLDLWSARALAAVFASALPILLG